MIRRKFITAAAWLSLLPFAWVIGRLEGRRRESMPQRRLSLPRPLGAGVFFHGQVVLVRDDAGLRAYSTRCTHLGCMIREVDDGLLRCPCHGSLYDLHGRTVRGPAVEGLKPLAYQDDGDGIVVIISG